MEYGRSLLYTEVLDTICDNKFRSIRVIYDLVSEKKATLLDRLGEEYSEEETEELVEYISSIPFRDIIIEFHDPEPDDEWD